MFTHSVNNTNPSPDPQGEWLRREHRRVAGDGAAHRDIGGDGLRNVVRDIARVRQRLRERRYGERLTPAEPFLIQI